MTLILEAGLDVAVLRAELEAMRAAADRAGVTVVGGDTKVVDHGDADELYITTAGIGEPHPGPRWARSAFGRATRCW